MEINTLVALKNLFDGYGTLTLQDGSIKKMFKANKFIGNSKK